MKIILTLIVFVGSCCGQVLKLDAGTTTLGTTGSGASMTAYLPGNTAVMSGGVLDGHVVTGISDAFLFHGDEAVIGTQQVSAAVEGGSVSMQGIGASLKHESGDLTSGVFLGSIGTSYFLPYVQSVTPHHLGAAAFAQRRLGHLKIGSVAAIAGNEHTALASALWKSSRFDGTLVGGLLDGQEFSTAVATYHTQRLNLFASHLDTFTPIRARSDGGGGALIFDHVTLSGSTTETETKRGPAFAENGNVSLQIGMLNNGVGIYHSPNGVLLTDNIAEKLNRHWSASQMVSRLEGSTTMSFGGGYASNRFSCSVSQGVGYSPVTGNYVRTTSAQVSFAIHGTKITAQGLLADGIKPAYQIGGEKFTQGPIHPSEKTMSHSSGGKYVVFGLVSDAGGQAIQGVAVLVGDNVLFSNREGRFVIYEKKSKPMTVRVDLGQTIADGKWIVKTCPETVIPSPEDANHEVRILLVHP